MIPIFLISSFRIMIFFIKTICESLVLLEFNFAQKHPHFYITLLFWLRYITLLKINTLKLGLAELILKKYASYVQNQIMNITATTVLITNLLQWKIHFYTISQNAKTQFASLMVLIALNSTLITTITHLQSLMISQNKP